MKKVICAQIIFASMLSMAIRGEEPGQASGKPVRVSGIEVDLKKQEVRVDATVCLSRGILEYLVCLPGTFEHEAIFSANCKPSQLHLSLLALGLETCPFEDDELWRESARANKKARLSVDVEYELNGKKERHPINRFLVNREKKDGLVPDEWIFTGSMFYNDEGKNRYAADITGAVIGLIPAGAAVIQFGEKVGIPYQAEDQGLEVNAETTPARGTKVALIFAPYKENERREETASDVAKLPAK